MLKKYLTIPLTFVIAISCFLCTLQVNAEPSVLSQNITWEQKNDVLYINGSGDMIIEHEYITEIPWYGIRNEISKIVIGEGITSIGDSAFADFRLVKEVVLPASLRVIGPAAFITCTSIETLALPYKITRIEDGAFVNCESLKSITIPGSIIEIADDAFYNCYDLGIVGVRDTYANKYADVHKIPFLAGIKPSEEILVRVNDKYVDFDQPPVIIDGRTLVPVRAIFEAMGIAVDWDASSRTVTAERGNTTIKMVIDSNVISKTIDGVSSSVEIDVPAKILGERTMVPARAPMENFGASVNWDAKTRTVIIED